MLRKIASSLTANTMINHTIDRDESIIIDIKASKAPIRIALNHNNTSIAIVDNIIASIKEIYGKDINIIKNYIEKSTDISNCDASVFCTNYEKLNVVKNEQTVHTLTIAPHILIASNSFPAKDLKGFEAEIKRASGKYILGIDKNRTVTKNLIENLKQNRNLNFSIKQYSNEDEAIKDLASNKIDCMFANYNNTLTHLQNNRFKPFLVYGEKRQKELSDIPTMQEAGWNPIDNNYFHITIFNTNGNEKMITKTLADQNFVKKNNNIGIISCSL